MTPIAPEDTIRALEDDERQAWSRYRDRLRELDGAAYERTESDSWAELQGALERVRERRHLLETHPT